jgi:hypothetical protein
MTNHVPPFMAPLLHNFLNFFTQLKRLHLSPSSEHTIDLIHGAYFPNAPSYQLTPRESIAIEHEIGQLLNSFHSQPSLSPCTFLTFIIPKIDYLEWCQVTDYCSLKNDTIKNCYPLPWIKDLMNHLQGNCFFTNMDLRVGYHRFHMNVTDTCNIAFRMKLGLFEWLVVPFGLTNAPTMLMILINYVYRTHLGKFMVICLDDILVFNNSWT